MWAKDYSVLNFNRLNLIKRNMLTYCVKCTKNTQNVNSKISKTKSNRLIMQSKCTVCGIKNPDLRKDKKQKVYWVIKWLKHHWINSIARLYFVLSV